MVHHYCAKRSPANTGKALWCIWFSFFTLKASFLVLPSLFFSEAWRPPQFQEKRCRSEKAILSRSSRRVPGYSRCSSRNSKFHSRKGIPRPEQCENHSSRSNSRSDSRNWWEPKWEIFICPIHSRSVFSRIGVVPVRKIFGLRRPPDYSSNLCMPKTFAIWLF